MNVVLILGNQLFDPKKYFKNIDKKNSILYMREDIELCTYFKFHKHKIIFFFSAMREYAEELSALGYKVHYEKLNEKNKTTYDQAFKKFLLDRKAKSVSFFEIEDKFFELRLLKLFKDLNLSTDQIKSPMFLTTRDEFKSYLSKTKKPFMKTFYEAQRKRLGILVDKKNQPLGGKWSFDTENRLPLPKSVIPTEPKTAKPSEITKAVVALVSKYFDDHSGDANNFWIPTTRKDAKKWLIDFLENRFMQFGPYEDALAPDSDFVFHSVLTPFLNTGLLTPDEVINEVLSFAKENKVEIQSVEGFVRQIIGWREFVRGIYQNYSEKQDTSNFFKHKRKLSNVWYSGKSSVPQISRTINKVLRLGYCHHIERLMVLGNLMVLLEIEPKEAHKWFMEMFVDSSDWVMGPNVYGMTLYSDGGLFATKPYICGSNYWRKMSKEPAGDWCDGIDGLYWRFIENNKTFFSKNPRLSIMAKSVEKMPKDRKSKIYIAADKLIKELTV